jgi:hypothetical protein
VSVVRCLGLFAWPRIENWTMPSRRYFLYAHTLSVMQNPRKSPPEKRLSDYFPTLAFMSIKITNNGFSVR